MELRELISAIKVMKICGNENIIIENLTSDSREVEKNTMFVAVKGVNVDGHSYIAKAIESGATAVICQEMPETINENITYILVADSSIAFGELASQWYGNPSREMQIVGVTGTNGKTTTATLLYEMARLMGYKAGLLSTVCNYVDNEKVPATHTTPDPMQLHALLRRMSDAGCSYAFMEVSSHAADQHRISGIEFAGGVFTNLTRDHLDYHKTVDAYMKAKKSFFDGLGKDAFALVNADDKAGMVMIQNTKAKKYTYTLRTLGDYKAQAIESRIDGTLVTLNGREVEVLFTGKFNVYNLLAVYGASCLLGFPTEEVLVNMSKLVPVAGRFQTLRSPKGYTAIVDYAHTPDALLNVLSSIREVIGNSGRIITVVGAGGNRDKGKRPIMAQEAWKGSDKLVLTSDNPRFEEPEDILKDMEAGLSKDALSHTLCITDRKEAIKTATQLAQAGDVILVAGKGHEDYQDIKGVKHHFDDKEVIEGIFKTEE